VQFWNARCRLYPAWVVKWDAVSRVDARVKEKIPFRCGFTVAKSQPSLTGTPMTLSFSLFGASCKGVPALFQISECNWTSVCLSSTAGQVTFWNLNRCARKTACSILSQKALTASWLQRYKSRWSFESFLCRSMTSNLVFSIFAPILYLVSDDDIDNYCFKLRKICFCAILIAYC